jgi:hypothetical protein
MNIPKPKEGEILYAIASERFFRGTWRVQGITHVHAKDIAAARFTFLAGEQGRRVRIVACGPAIGYHVEDAHGDVLSC